MSTSPAARPTPSRPGTPLDALLPAALLAAGSILFLGAGSRHPKIGAHMGPVGSDEFFLAFAHQIVRVPHWESLHAMILAGPVLWALGAAGATRLFPARVAALGEVGRAALLLGAGAWALAFTLDGFVAPMLARTVTASANPAGELSALVPFHTNQLITARLGAVSLVLIGAATTAYSLALLATSRATWPATVAVAGLLAGLWPLAATAAGEFAPGPFTSPYWRETALAIGTWFALLATALPHAAVVRRTESAPRAVPAA